jgi:hypothetical protein
MHTRSVQRTEDDLPTKNPSYHHDIELDLKEDAIMNITKKATASTVEMRLPMHLEEGILAYL